MLPDLELAYVIAATLLGLIIGSFLNVCIYRLPRDLSVVMPRSFCPVCGQRVAWHDNVPLVSYIALRGRCRSCRKPIGYRYPLVELVTAILFAVTAAQYGWSLAALKWAIFEAAMIVLFWTDFEERLLPDEFTLGGAVVGLILAIFIMVPGPFGDLLLPRSAIVWRSLVNAGFGAAILVLPLYAFARAYARIRKREGLGLGDVKLLLLIGVFLGVEKGLFALVLGSVGGSIIGIVYIFATHKDPLKYWLPLGSFLCAGAAFTALVKVV